MSTSDFLSNAELKNKAIRLCRNLNMTFAEACREADVMSGDYMSKRELLAVIDYLEEPEVTEEEIAAQVRASTPPALLRAQERIAMTNKLKDERGFGDLDTEAEREKFEAEIKAEVDAQLPRIPC